MSNEWDTGLFKNIEILATEAISKWSDKFYQKVIFGEMKEILVRVKEQKVKLIWEDNTSSIKVEVQMNDIWYEGIYFFNDRMSGFWKINESWSRIRVKGTCIVQGGTPVAKY